VALRRPTAAATAAQKSVSPRLERRGSHLTPEAKWGAVATAEATATRVLPTPPGPITLRTRLDFRSRIDDMAATSSARPIRLSANSGSRWLEESFPGTESRKETRSISGNPNASARRRRVVRRGVRRPRSNSGTASVLSPARAANVACESPERFLKRRNSSLKKFMCCPLSGCYGGPEPTKNILTPKVIVRLLSVFRRRLDG
jgi:hypothetical protein